MDAVAYEGVDGDLGDDDEPGYKEEYDFSCHSYCGKALTIPSLRITKWR